MAAHRAVIATSLPDHILPVGIIATHPVLTTLVLVRMVKVNAGIISSHLMSIPFILELTNSLSPGSKDSSRTPPRGPAADRRSYGDYMSNYRSSYSNRSHRSSPPSPRWRDRSRYRDRDRVYDAPRSRSRDWHSRSDSRSRSRSRSPSRGRRRGYGHESREIMLEGVPVDMNEDDVRITPPINRWRIDGLLATFPPAY